MIFQSDRQCKPPKLKMLLFTITVNCYCVLICLCELILIEEVYNQCFDETHGISAHIPRCCLCFFGGGIGSTYSKHTWNAAHAPTIKPACLL